MATFTSAKLNTTEYTSGTLRVYAFSPYFIEMTAGSAGLQVDLTWTVGSTNYTLTRYTGSDYKVKFPIQTCLQSFFTGIEFGQVGAFTGYVNTASKLMQLSKTLTVSATSYTSVVFTFDIIWGALQLAETESTEEQIYVFGNLPVTITQTIGTGFSYGTGSPFYTEEHSYGKEIDIQQVIEQGGFYVLEIKSSETTVVKTVYLKYNSCTEGVYLRWLYKGEYKYYLFKDGTVQDDLKDGSTVGHNILSMEATNNEIKSDISLKNKIGNPTYDCGVPAADYATQLHLIGLQRSLKQWVYENNVWIECSIKMSPVVINRFKSPVEVNLTVVKPSLFIESL